MAHLTDEQVEALNHFSRTHPHLAKVFGYTVASDKEGLGTALNSDTPGSGSGEVDDSFVFFIGHVGA